MNASTCSVASEGFTIVKGVLGHEPLEALRHAIGSLPSRHRGGVRNLLQDSEPVSALANSRSVKALVHAALGATAFPVRALLFDKPPDANWQVPWHQDTAIAVAERVEAPGFLGWSVKDGVTHVHPPAEILEQMVTVRIHLDDCGPENGPLRVLPGSHRHGKLDEAAIEHCRQTTEKVAWRRARHASLAAACFFPGDVAVPSPGDSR